MTRVPTAAAAVLLFALSATPARAFDPGWFLAGVVVGAVVAPAYGYPYGFRSGYAPVRAQAPWADQPGPGFGAAPPQQCHWAKLQHNGAWRHARICYEGVPVAGPQTQFSDTIISK